MFTSADGRILAVAAGRPPDDPAWEDVVAGMQEAVERLQHRLHFRALETGQRRQLSQTITAGISYGGGFEVRGLKFKFVIAA